MSFDRIKKSGEKRRPETPRKPPAPSPLEEADHRPGLPLFLRGSKQGATVTAQPKLAVSQPGDVHEQEADRVAEEVTSSASPTLLQRKCGCGSGLGPSGGCAQCGTGEQTLQRSPAEVSEGAAAPAVSEAMSSGSSHALDGSSRTQMESRFGQDFSEVRLHTDEEAAAAARAVKARAFTVGRDIYFDRTHYQPGTTEGQRLLAHELTHVVQQRGGAQPAIMRDPLAGQIPPEINLISTSVSFTIPGGKALTGDWNDVTTTDQTSVTISISQRGINLRFGPGFRIDTQWPASDMLWRGLNYDFRTASLTSIDLEDIQSVAVSAQGMASRKISAFFTELISGTRAAVAGYDPLTDPDLVGTLNSIKSNFESMPADSPGNVAATDIGNVEMSAMISFNTDIRRGTAEGGVVIPSGGSATIRVSFEGNAADVSSAATRRLRTVTIESDSITLQKEGADVARLQTIYINYGGAVTLGRFTALGNVAVAEGVESLVRVVSLMAILGSGTPSDRPALEGRDPNINPEIIHGLARSEIEAALSRAVRDLILNNCHTIPGVNLCDIFGIVQMGDFPLTPPTPPGTAAG